MSDYKLQDGFVEVIHPRILREEDVLVPDDFHGDPDEYAEEAIERSERMAHNFVLQELFLSVAKARQLAEEGEQPVALHVNDENQIGLLVELGQSQPKDRLTTLLESNRIRYHVLKFLTLQDVLTLSATCKRANTLIRAEEYWAMRWYIDEGHEAYCFAVNRCNASRTQLDTAVYAPIGLIGRSLREQYIYLFCKRQLETGLSVASMAPSLRPQIERAKQVVYTSLMRKIASRSDGIEAAADISTLSTTSVSESLRSKAETKVLTAAYREL